MNFLLRCRHLDDKGLGERRHYLGHNENVQKKEWLRYFNHGVTMWCQSIHHYDRDLSIK